ncbi:uncharacterized protein I303_102064 [Kwoniella dejecticola CBS 10117]|uniref:t-SNARE coiled-coil homology domain-containing protein n=1 Tax=Kwoniella dejecticola CBS 10117 TaxID=1296121 RepID=A0A1A6AC04_9TREE|nr:uncharacterized protein I303_01797 [Kwoniella dejecticola CBS 10117]OBR87589.1 hypothetical protein I303_01797 [Kwoniella dejecticola CBS 10117]
MARYRQPFPSAIPMLPEIRQTRVDSWKLHLRPLITQKIIHLPVDADEIESWCDICDKVIRHHDMEEEPIEEFRQLLFSTTFPSLETKIMSSSVEKIEAQIMANVDAKFALITARCDNLESRFQALSLNIKTVETRFNYLQSGANIHVKSAADNGDSYSLVDQLALTPAATTLERIDSRVDRLDAKIDRFDVRVDQLASQVKSLNEGCLVNQARLDQHEEKVKSIQKDIERLDTGF